MSISQRPVNSWNFLSWYSASGVTTSTLAELRPTVFHEFDDINYRFALPFRGGDVVSFYLNFDDAISTSGFANWKLGVISCDYIILVPDLAALNQDLIPNTSSYNIYSEFTWPAMGSQKHFYLIIYNSSTNAVLYVSTPFRNVSASDANRYTKSIMYRNSRNIFEIRYESLPDFYHKFRIPLHIFKPLPSEDSRGYDLSNGTYLRVRSTTKKQYTFITSKYDEFAHDAFFAMAKHHDFLRIDERFWQQASDASYEPEWPETDYPLCDAEIALTELSYSSTHEII
jgi:hypothetical protein